MATEVDDTYLILLLEALRDCACAAHMNGPSQYMLAQELVDLDKPVEAITLGELQAAQERVDVRYHRISACFSKRPGTIHRVVMVTKGVCVEGRWYTGPELADLQGEVVAIEIWPERSLTLLARHGKRRFQLHSLGE